MRKLFGMIFLLCASVLQAQDFEGLKTINGTKLFLSIKGKGETLVLLHGGPGLNHSYFKPHLNGLEKKFRLVYYDQRASGKSSTPTPDSITIKLMVEDLEGIRKELKLKKLNLLAHSWGAVLATHYAITYPDRVNKIIYSNPAMLSREYDAEAAAITKKKTSKEDSTTRARLMGSGSLNATQYDELMHISFNASAYDRSNMQKLILNLPPDFVRANTALFTGLMKDPSSNKANLYDSLKRFTFPTIIIHGQADVVPVASIERLKNNLSNTDLIVFTRSGHFPFVEENEKYLSVIEAFLKK